MVLWPVLAERGQFSEAGGGEGGQEDKGPPAGTDGVRDGEDLGDREDGTLRHVVGVGALGTAGVALDQFVVDGGVRDGPQELMGLDGGRFPGGPCLTRIRA
ncbi:hypothetical protein GCM10010495_16520 [Kitasatospora herbaricolor]|nr:hypothetical protein GCM10010495_16520 [Kitasatospora herbaricolor]